MTLFPDGVAGRKLKSLQTPAPAQAVGSTLTSLQDETDEMRARVIGLEMENASLELEVAQMRELMLEAADSLRLSSVPMNDKAQSNLSIVCYKAAWGIK